MEVTETWYLVLSALIFATGVAGVLLRRSPLVILLCLELVLNAGNLALLFPGVEVLDHGAFRVTRDADFTISDEADDGPAEVDVPEHLREVRVLSDAHLAELHHGVLRCERLLGRPADCEFSIVDGRILWLQCRPMTALGIPDAPRASPGTTAGPIDHTGAQSQ